MPFCSSCGKSLEEGAKFCSGCGTTLTGAQPTTTSGAAAAPAQVTRVVVVEAKKGGRLAFKGFLIAFILAVIFVAATKGDKSTQSVGMVMPSESVQPTSSPTCESGRRTTISFTERVLVGPSRSSSCSCVLGV
jgi:hypothetical protein